MSREYLHQLWMNIQIWCHLPNYRNVKWTLACSFFFCCCFFCAEHPCETAFSVCLCAICSLLSQHKSYVTISSELRIWSDTGFLISRHVARIVYLWWKNLFPPQRRKKKDVWLQGGSERWIARVQRTSISCFYACFHCHLLVSINMNISCLSF